MGVCIYATHSDYKFSISYSGFNYIRRVIAYRLGSDFGKLYEEWHKVPNNFYTLSYEGRMAKSLEYLNDMEKLVDDKNLDQSIVEFLFLPDTGSNINYKTCRKLAEVLLGDVEESYIFDWERFKEFLMECYSHRRSMRWC